MGLFTRFTASQLRKPRGLVGRLLVARRLDRLNAPLNQSTLESLALRPDDDVLEVGFGSGDLIDRISRVVTGGRIVGVDYSEDMVRLCEGRFSALVREGRVELRCASVDALPYDSESFTRACTVNTLYFWPDPAAALCEFRRVLVVGGRLVVTFSPRETLETIPVTRHGFTLYEPDDVHRLLEAAGFDDVRLHARKGPRGTFICAEANRRQ